MPTDTTRDAVIKRIHALLQKTPSKGCTQEEALLAAEKAGELMDLYGLSITDIELRSTKCVQKRFEIDGKNRNHMSGVTMALADYCDVKLWFSKGRDKFSKDPNDPRKLHKDVQNSAYIVFGLECDVEIFGWLFNVIDHAILDSLDTYKKSEDYKATQTHGRVLNANFILGMQLVLNQKLKDMKAARVREVETTGRSLVLVKSEMIEEEFKSLKVNLKKAYRYHRSRSSDAVAAGKQAGEKVQLNMGVRGTGSTGNLAYKTR